MSKIRFLKYQGAKYNFIDIINEYINQSSATTYVEPFVGSGAVFFNLEKEFDRYILNDLESHLIMIYESIRDSSYSDFKDMENICTIKYDIKKNKNDYYTFRNKVNEIDDEYIKGLGMYFLYNSCINSMARFGPNGFNSSYGNRFMTLSKEDYLTIQSKIKRAELNSIDFFELDIPEDSLLFLDPPYIERPTSYETISEDFFNKLMEYIKNTNNDILYTDIDHDFLDLDKVIIRQNMKNTSPNRKNNNTNKTEVMFYKIK